MTDSFHAQIATSISEETGIEIEKILSLLERPKNLSHGDLAFPCFVVAKSKGQNPQLCAKELATTLKLGRLIDSVEAVGPFLNFRFSRTAVAENVLVPILSDGKKLGTALHEEAVVVEYSSPNIAKPFHVGHLRATLIGNCLDRVIRHLGYKTTSVNHLGDWGTQFGFVWAGCSLWGKPDPATVESLVELYRRANSLREQEEQEDKAKGGSGTSAVNEMARKFFVDLENSEQYALEFWKWCSEISLDYLEKTYQRLGVKFDHYTGESFYSSMLDDVKSELESANLLKQSQGALGVDLGEELGFARIATPDGRSLYLARDIATAFYRAKVFNFFKSIYVVGVPQSLHFKQLVEILKKLKKPYASNMVHVAFGHVGGMKTRGGGEFIELNEFIDEAHERSLTAYREQVSKRPQGLDEEQVARGVAQAAILFSNLSRSRIKDVHFSWEHALEFQGDSGPYILYAYARINGIKEKALAQSLSPSKNIDPAAFTDESAYQLIAKLGEFTSTLKKTFEDYEPAHLSAYALELAKLVAKAYLDLKVIGEEKHLAENRLALFEATKTVLGLSLNLLGIPPLERM